MTLWALGYPDQALLRSQEALTLAQELSHPFSLAYTLLIAAMFHQFRRESHATQERAEAAMTLSTAQGFLVWLPVGTCLQGWALGAQGQGEDGIALICQGQAAWRAMGAELLQSWFLALLAETYGAEGQTGAGLTVLADAFAVVERTGERYWEAELHRLKGVLLFAATNEVEAEACFHQALDIARHQQARSLELRAATSLARLWKSQDKRQDAYDLLAPVYEWFTEGFDTADMQEASMLLDQLSGSA